MQPSNTFENEFESPDFTVGKYKIYHYENSYYVMRDQEGAEKYLAGILQFENAAKAHKTLSAITEKEIEKSLKKAAFYLDPLILKLIYILGFLFGSALLIFLFFELTLPNGLEDLTIKAIDQIQLYCGITTLLFGLILFSYNSIKQIVSKFI